MFLYFVREYVNINNITITTFNIYTCSQQTQKIVVVTFLISNTYSREVMCEKKDVKLLDVRETTT
jgi:hypothetical protein